MWDGLTTEMVLAIVVAVTGTTSLIGIIVLCWIVLIREEGDKDKDNQIQVPSSSGESTSVVSNIVEQHHQMPTPPIITTTSTMQQHRHKERTMDTENMTLPMFTLPNDESVGRHSRKKSLNSNKLRQQQYQLASSAKALLAMDAASNSKTVSSSYDDDPSYPRIRRFSASSSSSSQISDDESEDIMTFDDNWSYAMTEEGSQLVISDYAYTTPKKVVDVVESPRKIPATKNITQKNAVPISPEKETSGKRLLPAMPSTLSPSTSAPASLRMRTVVDNTGHIYYEV